ncbi:unnamed protein product [Polarella glacialis]|uniref:Peptidase M28 domain-containing protein n=1 Tax=Polarella glacialis TaxID=89957 RepID=A0A813FYF9_POLGL|nr:unnamed protein product [Polarella glacialis]
MPSLEVEVSDVEALLTATGAEAAGNNNTGPWRAASATLGILALGVLVLGAFTVGGASLRVSGEALARSRSEKDELHPVMAYLSALTRDSAGKANPRVACTEGNYQARLKLARDMEAMGMRPLGTSGPGNFTWHFEGSKDDAFCPHGISNVIGYVEGSDPILKEEFIMYDAHYDGAKFGLQGGGWLKLNGEVPGDYESKFGNEDTDTAFDDGAAVAVGMTIAKQLLQAPPKRSVIFSFSDAEEGAENLGTPEPGQTERRVPQKFTELFLQLGKTQGQFPIGLTAWSKKPTVDLQKIKLVIAADPLGFPGIAGSDFLAIMGVESTPGLQDLVESLWPEESKVTPVFANRKYTSSIAYSDSDAFSSGYECDPSVTPCLPDGRIPFLWMAQAGFRQYHGGMDYTIPAAILASFNNQGLDMSADPAYFTRDRSCTLDSAALVRVYDTLSGLLARLADSDGVGGLAYKKYNYKVSDEPGGASTYTLKDAKNNVKTYQVIKDALAKGSDVTGIPELSSTHLLQGFAKLMGLTSQVVAAFPPGTPDAVVVPNDEFQKALANSVVGAVLAPDFFKSTDPGSIAKFSATLPDQLLLKCPR